MSLRSITLLALSILAASAFAQDGWKRPDTVFATFKEVDGTTHDYKLAKTSDGLVIETTRSANGALGGVSRIESISKSGVYTWLTGKLQVALQLPNTTIPGITEFLAVPRFSRADLEFNLDGIQKSLGKAVRAGKTEDIAGRKCLVLTILDRPDSATTDFQRLWVDVETGLSLKVEDYFGGKLTYSREVTDIAFNDIPEGFPTTHATNATIIRGAVSPETLLKMPSARSHDELKADLANLGRPKDSEDSWTTVIPELPPLRYAQTSYREQTLRMSSSDSSNRRQNAIADPQSGTGTVLSEVVTLSGGGEGRIMSISAIRLDSNARDAVYQFTTDSSGNTLVMRGEESSGAGSTGQDARIGQPTIIPVAKSDFVDPKSGHTLTFVQVKGRPADQLIGPYLLGTPAPIQGLESGRSYAAKGDVDLTIVAWKKGEIHYAIASTQLPLARMVEIAKSVK